MTETETKTNGFDIDAILGELEPKPLTYKGQTFNLPAEFPALCLAPFLDDDLGLIELISEAIANASDTASITDTVFAVLRARKSLPKQLVEAAKDAFRELLDTEAEGQYAAFIALRPSVNAYLLIARGIVGEYGVGLTDFFDSGNSSEDTEGEPSKQTSPTTTPEAEKQTSEAPSDAPETPASSE